MSYQTLELTIQNGVAKIQLNQPETGNPFNATFFADWRVLANELSARNDVRAILLCAKGKFFSVGGDLNMFAGRVDSLPSSILEGTSDLHMGIGRVARLDAPVIAAVQGACFGGACALVANCDLVFSGRSATFGAAYSKIGFSCDAGSTFGLSSRMGISRARRFILMAETLEADAAAQAGLVDAVYEDATLLAEAEKVANRLAQGPTRAYGEVRRLFVRALARPIEVQLEEEAQALTRVARTADAREGLKAFVEKRKPLFTGQ